MTLPENVGYPTGEDGSAIQGRFYMLEVHYDNPKRAQGLQFKTGVRFYFTENVRYV